MSDFISDWMIDIQRLRAQWAERCARVVDPRDITHLVWFIHGDSEVMRLRGSIVGEFKVEWDARTLTSTARALVYGLPLIERRRAVGRIE